jgi:hypothetical protein
LPKTVVTATDAEGIFVAVARVSDAVEAAGIERHHLIGEKLWVFHDPQEAAAIRDALAKCIASGEDQRLFLTSSAGGREENWMVQFVACHKPAAAIVIGYPMDAPQEVSPEERDLLHALAHDRTIEDYARDRQLSPDIVSARVRKLRARFHVKSTAGLVGVVMRLGVV